MFKPTLKRHQLNPFSDSHTYFNTQSKARIQNNKQLIKHKITNDQLYLPEILSYDNIKVQTQKQSKLISPLKYWDLQYPVQVKQKLNMPINQVKSRLVGSKFGIFWLIVQNQLYIWRYECFKNPSSLLVHRMFQFQKSIRAIDIGHLNPLQCSLINISENCQMIAVGFDHIIDLYSINLQTLELKPINIRFKIQYNETLQKIIFSQRNQLFYASDQGFLTRISFSGTNYFGYPKISKQNARPALLSSKSIWSTFQFNNKIQSRVFVQRILIKTGKIYVLIRRQSQGSLIHRLGLSIVKFLSGKIKNQQQNIKIQKQIHVYSIVNLNNNNNNNIKFDGIIKNSQIQTKIRQCYSANDKIKNILQNSPQSLDNTICNIFNNNTKQNNNKQSKIDDNTLSIVTNYGLFITIRENVQLTISNINNFNFMSQPQILPNQLYKNQGRYLSNGLFLRSQEKFNKNLQRNSELVQMNNFAQHKDILINSFGWNNLNFLSNGLCFYFDQQEIQILKLDKYPGFIQQNIPNSRPNEKLTENYPEWFVFSKSQITVIKKSQHFQYIIAALNQYEKLHENTKSEQLYQNKNYEDTDINQLIKIIGNKQILKSLYKFLLKNKNQSNSLGQNKNPIIYINNQSIQIAKQYKRIQKSNIDRLRYHNFEKQIIPNLFNRWVQSKKIQTKLMKIQINKDLQNLIWKYFLVSSSINNSQKQNFVVEMNNVSKVNEMSIYSHCIISHFRNYYSKVKNLSILQIKKSPQLINQAKNCLLVLFNFLKQKKQKSLTLIKNFTYFNPIKTQNINNKNSNTQDSISTMQRSMINQENSTQLNSMQRNNFAYNYNTGFKTKFDEPAIQYTQEQLCRVIPKIINLIELYEIIAANFKQTYQKIPTIQQFIESLSARRQVKNALLDIFSTTNLLQNQTINKANLVFPQMGLQADLQLLKWLNFVHRAERNVQFQQKSTIDQQIKISNIEQLSLKLQIEQILKIKSLLKRKNSKLYLKLLTNNYLMKNKIYQTIKEIKDGQDQDKIYRSQNKQQLQSNFLLKFNDQNKEKQQYEYRIWINSQLISLKNEINNFLQESVINISNSSSDQFLNRQKQFQQLIKIILDNFPKNNEFIQNLIKFLKQKSLMPQKIHELQSYCIDIPVKSTIQSFLKETSKPEFMSSLSLVNNFIKRGQEQIFVNVNDEQYKKLKEINQTKQLSQLYLQSTGTL